MTTHDPAPSLKPQPLRRVRRMVAGYTPVAVWLLAIVAAFELHGRLGTAGALKGLAEETSLTLTHLDPGVVRNIHVRLHEAVQAGQILVTMDDTEERLRLVTLEKDIERLQANVLAERARLAADNARAQMEREDLSRRFLVDREVAHLDYLTQVVTNATDRVLLRGTQVEFDIVRRLYEADDANFREFNALETEIAVLQDRISRNEGVEARKKQAFDDADRRWNAFANRESVAAVYDPVLTPLRLAAEVRERELAEVVRQVDLHVLRAPLAGQVTQVYTRAGERLLAGSALVTISPRSTDRVVAYLPETRVLDVRVGESVTVHRLASGSAGRKPLSGTVVSVASAVNEAPMRYRTVPNWAVWGRSIVVKLSEYTLLPGEAVTISLARN